MKKSLRKTRRTHGYRRNKVNKPIASVITVLLLSIGLIPLCSTLAPGEDLADYSIEENAYINGSPIAQNGTAIDYQDVSTDDIIKYEVKVTNNGVGPSLPPLVPNPTFMPKETFSAPTKINFLNGSFESPIIKDTANADVFQIIPQANVPGWSVRPGSTIELQKPWSITGAFQGRFAKYAADGTQYAELNSDFVGTLYQVCNTVPGTKVYYEFYHGARGALPGGSLNTDVMNFYLRAEGATSGGLQATCSDSCYTDPFEIHGEYKWGHYTGEYTVPDGQTRTEFSFQSASSTSGDQTQGNFLDGIRFYTGSFVELEKSNNAPGKKANIGDKVTYTIVAKNTGESDARNVKISDVLPAGTELVSGTVKIGNATTSNYSYNSATREIVVNVGGGATSSSGGLIKGTGSFSTDCNDSYTITFQIKTNNTAIAENLKYENQAKAVYEDRYQTSSTSLVNYSNVDEFGINAKTIEATVTYYLPPGLTFIDHAEPSGAVFSNNGSTCTWTWVNLPPGESTVTVTVKVEPNTETTFVSHSDLTVEGSSEDSNFTYHKLNDEVEPIDFDAEKNAYINGSSTAQNGTEDNYQLVKRNDLIEYEIRFNNDTINTQLPPKTQNPSFQTKASAPAPINFVNGSFEDPSILPWEYVFIPYDGVGDPDFPHGVPGWATRPTNPADASKPGVNEIEIQRTGGTSSMSQQFAPNTPDGGTQFAELNAKYAGTLYQICNTVPGTKVYYEFYHGARMYYSSGINTDVMNFYLRAEGMTSGGLQKVCSDSATRGKPYVWGHYTGEYIVPAGQTRTEFSFESVSTLSGDTTSGNFLDGIRLYTGSYIDLEKSNNAPDGKVEIGDTVTYTIVATNTGESDSRNVKISDVLPAGIELVSGSVKIDGTLTSNYNYDATTRELVVHVGAGADSSAGGLFKGVGSPSTDCNNSYTISFQIKTNDTAIAENLKYENQAKVVYEDRNDTAGDVFINYSNVDEFKLDYLQIMASVTDVLPDGLIYVSHTNDNGSSFEINGQTCVWTWDDLPTGETVVKVLVRVDPTTEVTFVNHATVQIGSTGKDTNNTYHTTEMLVIEQFREKVDHSNVLAPDETVQITAGDDYVPGPGVPPATIAKNGNTYTYWGYQVDGGQIHKGAPESGNLPSNIGEPHTITYLYTAGDDKNATVNGQGVDNGSKGAPVIVLIDDIITYEISLHNSLPPTALSSTVTDVIPEGLEVQSISHNGVLDPDGRTVTWDLTELDEGPLVLVVTVKVTKAGVFENTAYVAPWNEDAYYTNTTFHKTDKASFEFYKTDGEGAPLTGADFALYSCTKAGQAGHAHDWLVSSDVTCCWGDPIDVSSGPDGFVGYSDLPLGEYMLVETKTIPGYHLPSGQWLIEIDDVDDITITAHGSGGLLPPAFRPGTGDYAGFMILPNYHEMTMPQAGGAGYIFFAVLGVVCLGSALIFLILSGFRKRGGSSSQ